MKVRILRTLQPNECFRDADTGDVFEHDPQASEPVRLLPQGTPEPTFEAPRVPEADLAHIRKVLEHYQPAFKVHELTKLLDITDWHAIDLIRQGDEHVLNYFIETVNTRNAAIVAAYAAKHAEKHEAWVESERRRLASMRLWAFRNKLVEVDNWETGSREEVITRVKLNVLRENDAFSKMKKDIERFEQFEKEPASQREPIPEAVRTYVWRRDEGRCVRCGSQERLEYDHIIPLEKGGSNTARNLQILCERCNREKGVST